MGVTLDDLTPRQQQIMLLIAKGLSNRAIAQRLRLATPTIKNHISVIRETANMGGNRIRGRRAQLIAAFFDLVPKRAKRCRRQM